MTTNMTTFKEFDQKLLKRNHIMSLSLLSKHWLTTYTSSMDYAVYMLKKWDYCIILWRVKGRADEMPWDIYRLIKKKGRFFTRKDNRKNID